ncbi:LysR family transcriptional regulator [Achromobacter xylosoxidans]
MAVAERASFRAAAEDLNLSQPALSRRIDKLEDLLGARLLERTTRRVALTHVGRIFLERARGAIDELERAVLSIGDLAAQRGGLVTVACVPSVAYYFLPAIIHDYAARFPRIRVRIIDETAHTVLNSVVTGRADFGISFSAPRSRTWISRRCCARTSCWRCGATIRWPRAAACRGRSCRRNAS